MSAQNVSTVEAMFAAVGRGEMDTAMSFFHPKVKVSQTTATPYAGEYDGHNGFLEMLGLLGDAYEFEPGTLELYDGGDIVTLRMTVHFTSKATGQTADSRMIEVYEFVDDLISSIDIFYKDPVAVGTAAVTPTVVV